MKEGAFLCSSPFHCAHPAEDVQVSQIWRLACPLRRFPFVWLTVYAVPLPHRWGRQVLWSGAVLRRLLGSVSLDSQVALLPYESSSLATRQAGEGKFYG